MIPKITKSPDNTRRGLFYRVPLKTHRMASGEKNFRQSKQKSARIVDLLTQYERFL